MPDPDTPPAARLFEGPRGEGWVVAQLLLGLLFVALPRRGRAWPPLLRRGARLVGLPLLLLGGLTSAWGANALGSQLTPLPQPTPHGHLIESGPYRLVRHPIYTGVMLGALGLALLTHHTGRLLLTAALALFFDAKARREERRLVARHPAYAAYQRRVCRFFPGLY